MSVTADAAQAEHHKVGSYGWRASISEGAVSQQAAAVSYRASAARVEASLRQFGGVTQATTQMDGAIATMGGGVYFANRIGEAFAVVDAGVPDVEVMQENRPVGKTDANGKFLVPSLRSWEANAISIDPTNLPVDAEVPLTRQTVVPKGQRGIMVKFGASAAPNAALVTLRDASGAFIKPGADGQLEGSAEHFTIGYDGQAYIRGLSAENLVTITKVDGTSCSAKFSYEARPGEQVQIPDAICQ
jgi:outer membrane usher protein